MEVRNPESVLVLDEDRALGEMVPPEALERARRASVAAVLRRPNGSWAGGRDSELARGGFGLLVLEGLLVRRVGVDGRFGAELLAAGDLLRPWQHDGAAGVLPFELAWRVVAPVRLAALDLRWATRMARLPRRRGRADRPRARPLAPARDADGDLAAAAARPAGLAPVLGARRPPRHGPSRRRPPRLRLTHEVISHLVAARRPSVSAALTRLARRGVLRRHGPEWLLTRAAAGAGVAVSQGRGSRR